MKIIVAMFKHETNTFSPLKTGKKQFEEWGLHFEQDVVQAYEGTAMPIASYFQACHNVGADLVTPFAAEAMPGGIVCAETYDFFSDIICDAVCQGCDAVLLDLHGAMVAENAADGEGELLRRIRELAPSVPIGVTCDFHGNITQLMVENCTVLMGYKTYPHTDMHIIGSRVAELTLRALNGSVRPVMAWGNRPLLAQTLRMGTDDEPMRTLIAKTRQLEVQQALGVTLFGGFPLADFQGAGVSAVVITDNSPNQASEICDDILNEAWKQKADFIYTGESLSDSVARAKKCSEQPLLLLDHADNCGSGGTQDVMVVIAEVIRQNLRNVAVAAVYDPGAVQQMIDAGVGAEISLQLGGKIVMPIFDVESLPLVVKGTVRSLTNGKWKIRGEMYKGVEVDLGPTAVLDTGNVELIVVSHRHEPWDTGIFLNAGIDLQSKSFILLKSRIHHRAAFNPIVKGTILCDGEGVTTSDNYKLAYQNIRRPIYPLDVLS